MAAAAETGRAEDGTEEEAEASGGRSTAANVVNFLLFQVVYVACVLGARDVSPWLGVIAGAALLPLNLLFLDPEGRRRDLLAIAFAGAFGAIADSALRATGVLAFAPATVPGGWPAWIAPPWILCLWFALGTLAPSSLAWMARLPVAVQAALGAGSGILSFWSASRLGVTELPMGAVSFAALGFEYALVVPILLRLAQPPPPHGGAP